MSESLRILFLTDFYPPYVGGLPVLQSELASRLVKRGHDVMVVTSRLPGTKPREITAGVEVRRFGLLGISNRYVYGAFGIASFLGALSRCDIVQGTTFVPAFPTSVSARISNKPSVLTVLEVLDKVWDLAYQGNPFARRFYRNAERLLLRLPFTRYVAISDFTRRRLEAFGIEKTSCDRVYPGVDYTFWNRNLAEPERFLLDQRVRTPFLYLSYGRAGSTKGVELLLDAATIVAETLPNSRLLLVLNEGQTYLRMVNRIGRSTTLSRHVVLMKNLPKTTLRDAVASADCVVVPSLSEGFGFVVAEACAMGTPVIAANVGSVSEVVSGRHLLVHPRDSRALADAIVRGANGQWLATPAKHFSWDAAVQSYEASFRVALQGGTGRGS